MSAASVGTALSMHDPRTVGPWTIHSRLGAGGMGVVFYGTDGDKAAAVKVIRPGLLDSPATRDRFRREVSILRTVRDAHICHYLDADLEHEPAWLALEYLSGPVLRDEVSTNGPLAEGAWWELARGISQALAVLELHRVTHRDLKPGNVILNERGAVLIDFGIAHPEDATQLTATGLVTGSPAWLSPEQANLDPTGPATDVFTFGSLLAFAATGRPPFGEGASVAVLMSIIKRDPDLAGIDPVRAGMLLRMLDKDPAKRPTAREVLDWSRAAVGGADLTAELAPAPADATLLDAPGDQAGRGVEPGTVPADGSGTQPDAPWWPDGATPTETPAPTVVAPAAAAPPPPPGATAAARPAPLVPPPPPRTQGRTAVGPRSAAAADRRAGRRRWLIGLLALATALLVGWLLMGGLEWGSEGAGDEPGGNTPGASTPAQAGQAPPAPSSDQLRSGDWVLMTYRFDNTADGMIVSGTVRNAGGESGSADLTTWVYQGTESLGSVSTTVTDVPAGATVPVTMSGDAVWKPGAKKVLLEATPR
jgi:tRNA A-37 threonylcarbamoyl transferase component Bud32